MDPATQLQDIRLFERNLGESVNSLRQLRRRYICVAGLLVASSAYWTWRLRENLSDPAPRVTQESVRLWFAWALLGIAPAIVFFMAMYQTYSAENGRLLRIAKTEPREPNFRQPLRLRTSYRSRGKSAGR